MFARFHASRCWQVFCLLAVAVSACYATQPKSAAGGVQGKAAEDRVVDALTGPTASAKRDPAVRPTMEYTSPS